MRATLYFSLTAMRDSIFGLAFSPFVVLLICAYVVASR